MLYLSVSPEGVQDSIEIERSNELVWSVGEDAKITWNSNSIAAEVVDVSSITIDIVLMTFIENEDQWKEAFVLASNIPNSGNISVTLPSVPSINKTEFGLQLSMLKISVSSSSDSFVSRRSASESSTAILLTKYKKWGKLLVIGYLKYSIAARVLCEVWHSETPSVDQRQLPPCPCRKDQALRDDRYDKETGDLADFLRKTFFHRGSESCFRQATVR